MPWFFIIAVWVVPLALGFYFAFNKTEWKRWLREHEYQEVRKVRRFFFQGPFTGPGGYKMKVYQFTIRDNADRERSGWIRFRWGRTPTQVEWDEEDVVSS